MTDHGARRTTAHFPNESANLVLVPYTPTLGKCAVCAVCAVVGDRERQKSAILYHGALSALPRHASRSEAPLPKFLRSASAGCAPALSRSALKIAATPATGMARPSTPRLLDGGRGGTEVQGPQGGGRRVERRCAIPVEKRFASRAPARAGGGAHRKSAALRAADRRGWSARSGAFLKQESWGRDRRNAAPRKALP